MRLDAYIAHATGLSRRQVKLHIRSGDVQVDGVVRPLFATPIADTQAVWLQGERLALPGPCYLMLNKPAGVVSSTTDRDGTSVLQLLPAALRRNLHIVGRLDADTTGLLLLSNDGQWSHRITSPRSGCAKVYRVTLDRELESAALAQLESGVLLRGEAAPTLPAQVSRIDSHTVRLTIAEGRYHQVKRMLAAVGNHVVSLHREQIGDLSLDPALAAGQFRTLTDDEIRLF